MVLCGFGVVKNECFASLSTLVCKVLFYTDVAGLDYTCSIAHQTMLGGSVCLTSENMSMLDVEII